MAVKASAQITLTYIVDVKAYYRYYLLQSSTAATPSKPDTHPPASEWNDTEPTYTEGSTDSLYFVDCTVFNDDTFKYSEVSFSSSYESAKLAYNKADNAEEMAEGAQGAVNEAVSEIASVSAQQIIDGGSIATISNQLANLIVGENGESVFKEVLEDGTVRYNFANVQKNLNTYAEQINELATSGKSAKEIIDEIQIILAKHSDTLSYIDKGDVDGVPFLELGVKKDESGSNESIAKFKVRITNQSIQFLENDQPVAWIDNEELHIRKSEIVSEQKVGGFVWAVRPNGNMGLMWKGVSS